MAQNIDVLHYQFEVTLNEKNDSIDVVAWIDFIYRKPGSFVIDLKSLTPDGKGMQITSLSLASDWIKQTKYIHQDDKITILPERYEVNDSDDVLIHYKGIPADGLIISKNKYGERTFFADNWPNRAHQWLACVDNPNDKAKCTFIVVSPSQFSVISNGEKVTDTSLIDSRRMTTWKEDTPLPTKVMVIGVAKFATRTFEDSPKHIPVSAWVYPQDSTKGFYDYALATDILKFFSSYIAPFPYNKLANVQSKTVFGGMENASCIFYEENSITGTRSCEDLLAHEIAHQWFGDMATEKSFAHLWLSEGFATYFTDLYFEHKYGREAFLKRLKKERAEALAFAERSTHPVVDTTSDLMSLLNVNSYQKGAWVLHMLRQEVGDSTFHKIIQAYYNNYKGGNADSRDFEAVAEKVSGKELKWFFDQWLYTAGIPKLSVQRIINDKGIYLKVGQLQPKLYQLTLPITVIAAGTKEKILSFKIKDRTQTFFVSNDKNAKLIIDPNSTLLYEEVK